MTRRTKQTNADYGHGRGDNPLLPYITGKKVMIYRPRASQELGKIGNGYVKNIEPAFDLPLWIKNRLLNPDAKLFNADHKHLADFIDDGQIVFLWAANGFTKQMKQVRAQTEQVAFRAGGFQRMRQEQQLNEWFGTLPEFIITLDATYCAHCTDTEFCALIDHELYHIAHALDEYDQPKFDKETGLPKLAMRGHEVEEFIGIIERYGSGDVEGAVTRLIQAGNTTPLVTKADIAQICGTALKLVV